MDTLRARVELCMSRHPDLRVADIARHCKVRQPSVHGWLNGSTKTLKAQTAHLAGRLFGCNPHWLATGLGSPNWAGGSTTLRELEPSWTRTGDLLETLGLVLARVPKERREAVGHLLDGWAREAGADHYRTALLALLDDRSGKRQATGT